MSVSILGPEMNKVTRAATDLKSKRKCRGYRSNCCSCEKKAGKKSELYEIQEPLTSVIPVQSLFKMTLIRSLYIELP